MKVDLLQLLGTMMVSIIIYKALIGLNWIIVGG